MDRRSLPAAVALTAATALLLTACGSEEKPSDNDKIAGAARETKKTTPQSPSPDNTATRPQFDLPADIKHVYDGWKTGDSVKDTILKDVANAQNATVYAVTQGDPNEPAMTFYRKGEAQLGGAKWVQDAVDAGITFTGTARYFAPKVEVFDETSAGVVFCVDESQAFNKDRKTNEIDKTPTTDDSYVLYNTRLEKNDEGVWETTKLVSQRGHETCTP